MCMHNQLTELFQCSPCLGWRSTCPRSEAQEINVEMREMRESCVDQVTFCYRISKIANRLINTKNARRKRFQAKEGRNFADWRCFSSPRAKDLAGVKGLQDVFSMSHASAEGLFGRSDCVCLEVCVCKRSFVSQMSGHCERPNCEVWLDRSEAHLDHRGARELL